MWVQRYLWRDRFLYDGVRRPFSRGADTAMDSVSALGEGLHCIPPILPCFRQPPANKPGKPAFAFALAVCRRHIMHLSL